MYTFTFSHIKKNRIINNNKYNDEPRMCIHPLIKLGTEWNEADSGREKHNRKKKKMRKYNKRKIFNPFLPFSKQYT